MPFPEDLLEQARHLANRERKRPRQASLRRSVSTAYYAFFHLLISEATLNWRRPNQRHLLARFFEHGKMKSASERQRRELNKYFKTNPPPPPGHDFITAQHLHTVANAFIKAQDYRHDADYDNSIQWTRTEVLTQIDAVAEAFESWRVIRDEPAAQTYLISLLGKDRAHG
jgi:uncharacterized protein (UPF0332 family)